MNARTLFLSIFALAAPEIAGATELSSRVTDITIIPVKNGINHVENFAPDGRGGVIVQGWRDNGNAHGYSRYMALVEMERKTLNVVTIDTHDRARGNGISEIDSVRDDPHTGEDVVSTVKFARAKVDGTSATVLIIATRDLSKAESLPDVTPVDVEFYRMVENSDAVGWPPYYFDLFSRERLKGTYANANCGLAKELGIAVSHVEDDPCVP